MVTLTVAMVRQAADLWATTALICVFSDFLRGSQCCSSCDLLCLTLSLKSMT